jgi:hypothetical protein
MPEKERGALLTVWLVLMLAANVLSTLLYSVLAISPLGRILFLPPNIQLWVIYVFMFGGLLNVVCVIFLFLWKKWAFFVLCANAGTAFTVNVFLGVGVFAFIGLAGVVILYLILRPKWSLFNNF